VSAALEGVTCVGANQCWAVGWAASPATGYPQAVAEEDTGGGWVAVSTPAPPGSASSQLSGVDCAGTGDCWAVGSYWTGPQGTAAMSLPLIEADTGDGWQVVAGPSPGGAVSAALDAVTCVSTADCWAVGYSSATGPPGPGSATLIEQDTGGGWSIVASPAPSPTGRGGQLAAVTCVDEGDCWTVGDAYAANGVPHTLIEQYTGSVWSVVSSPSPTASGSGGSQLLGVTCTSQGDCWSVGFVNGAAGATQALVEDYGASGWSVATGTPPRGQLFGVACEGTGGCWAVGDASAVNGGVLIAQGAGTGWGTVSSTSAYGGTAPQLNDVACPGTGECWAVGGPSPQSGSGSLILEQLAGATS